MTNAGIGSGRAGTYQSELSLKREIIVDLATGQVGSGRIKFTHSAETLIHIRPVRISGQLGLIGRTLGMDRVDPCLEQTEFDDQI